MDKTTNIWIIKQLFIWHTKLPWLLVTWLGFKKSSVQSLEGRIRIVQTLFYSIPGDSYSKQNAQHCSVGHWTIGKFSRSLYCTVGARIPNNRNPNVLKVGFQMVKTKWRPFCLVFEWSGPFENRSKSLA